MVLDADEFGDVTLSKGGSTYSYLVQDKSKP